MRRYDDSSDSGTSDDVAVSIAKVRAAILASDVRAASKPRTNYASRSAQNKTYKPTGVVASNFTYSGPNARSVGTPFGQVKSTQSNFNYTAPRASKPKAKSSSTSFKKGGVAGVLKSPEAKKFRETFKKKGLLPALRGK